MFTKKAQIKDWLYKNYVRRYEILDDLSVVAKDSLQIIPASMRYRGQTLTQLPVHFKECYGDFIVSGLGLTTLEGTPAEVNGNFDSSYNALISLTDGPKSVKGTFNCSHNQLTTLLGVPEVIKSAFICSNNRLTTLEGGPQVVGSFYDCSHNRLHSLRGAPEFLSGNFNCEHNLLVDLVGAPGIEEGFFNCSHNPNLHSLKGFFGEDSADQIFFFANTQIQELESFYPLKNESPEDEEDVCILNFSTVIYYQKIWEEKIKLDTEIPKPPQNHSLKPKNMKI